MWVQRRVVVPGDWPSYQSLPQKRSGVYYYPPGESAFNGLLFKDFVLNGERVRSCMVWYDARVRSPFSYKSTGFDGSYWFYILQTATKRVRGAGSDSLDA